MKGVTKGINDLIEQNVLSLVIVHWSIASVLRWRDSATQAPVAGSGPAVLSTQSSSEPRLSPRRDNVIPPG